MKKWKVVVTDWEYADLRYEEAVLLNDQIDFVTAQCRTEEEVIAACRNADGIINQYAPIGDRVISALENCKIITRYGVGIDTIDVESATKKGICVANVPDYCKDEVSDHALGLLLSWARKVTQANEHVKSGTWDFKTTVPIYRLRGRVLGLIGFGMIAQSLAAKVKPLGLQVIVHDPFLSGEVAEQHGVELVTLEKLCQQADFVSIHIPLTNATIGLIGREHFKLMKREALLINTSRGPIIQESALIEALHSGLIAGAALDVLEKEPISPDHPLLSMNNVILTPHVAWYSEESAAELRFKVAMGVADVLLYGEYPKYLVNKAVKANINLRETQSAQRYSFIPAP